MNDKDETKNEDTTGGGRLKREVRQRPKPEPEPKKHSFETFRKLWSYELSNMRQEQPSCFNGRVSVKRYRVTIEEIEEPDEVIKERIQGLWDECKNHHHWEPLKRAARQYGLELKHA